MKIKLDFVTNSSSTSFVVIGTYLELDDIPLEYLQSIATKHETDVEAIKEDPYEYMDDLVKGSDLEFSFGSEYDEQNMMIGISYGNMGDDETLKGFKQRVQMLILEQTGMKCQPHHIEECWRDG